MQPRRDARGVDPLDVGLEGGAGDVGEGGERDQITATGVLLSVVPSQVEVDVPPVPQPVALDSRSVLPRTRQVSASTRPRSRGWGCRPSPFSAQPQFAQLIWLSAPIPSGFQRKAVTRVRVRVRPVVLETARSAEFAQIRSDRRRPALPGSSDPGRGRGRDPGRDDRVPACDLVRRGPRPPCRCLDRSCRCRRRTNASSAACRRSARAPSADVAVRSIRTLRPENRAGACLVPSPRSGPSAPSSGRCSRQERTRRPHAAIAVVGTLRMSDG